MSLMMCLVSRAVLVLLCTVARFEQVVASFGT
jgi:hypothetical protein